MANMTRVLVNRAFLPTCGNIVSKRSHKELSQQLGIVYTHSHRLTHHPTFKHPDITTDIAARNLILRLDDKGRDLLFDELAKFKNDAALDPKADVFVPRSELWKVFFFNGLPFIGFGILDNMIMILAGEYIDVTLGAAFGISTMAAAALGNLISDVVGVGSAGYVEALVGKIGVDPPNITPAQAISYKCRWTSALGRALGIMVGCLIGMFPLLFIDSHRESENSDENPSKESQDTKENAPTKSSKS
jgi:hypothetical protein